MLVDFRLFVKLKKLSAPDYARLLNYVDGCIARYELTRTLNEADQASSAFAKACESDIDVARMIERDA